MATQLRTTALECVSRIEQAKLGYGGLFVSSSQFLIFTPCLKNDARLKNGQK